MTDYPPHAGVRRFADYQAKAGPDHTLRDRCDVVVVGSGPGGSVVTQVLAAAGHDVILVEEGPPIAPDDFRQDGLATLRRLVRESGMRATRGNLFMPTMQAIGLGGGTLINSAIAARPPAFVFDKWAAAAGTDDLSLASLTPHYDRIEQFWGVEPTPDSVQGERNLSFKRGCDALGIAAEPIRRNVRGCRGSGECFTGCRNAAKQSTDLVYIRDAIAHGARVYSSVRIEKVLARGRRASAVIGHVVEPFGHTASRPVHIEAKLVVLAAGCMATPVLLERSGLANSSGYVGRELQLHPGLAIMALYPHRVEPWYGATQGYHSLALLEQGLKLEVLWAPPAVLAARLPGLGADFQRNLARYDRMAPYDVIVAADHSRGTVRAQRSGFDPSIRFTLHQADIDLMIRGVAILSDIAWAAGAVEILPGLHGIAESLYSPTEAEVLRRRSFRGPDLIATCNHAFGTTRMARRPGDGVVDLDGRCHDLDNLYIADSGIFVGSPAVNPMLTVMALADRIAQGIARRV
jgi:choline dehydrogenase-like flavoprotein